MVIVPTKKPVAVTIRDEYFFKICLEIIAPITQEKAARIIKIFPVKIGGEKLPLISCGMPAIIKLPEKPKIMPNKLTI